MSQNQRCAISNVDSFLGYNLAYRFLEGRHNEDRGENAKVRLLCRDRRHLEPLEQLGGEIIQVNYQDQNKVREALQDVQYLLFVPENSNERIKEGENIIRAAKEQKIEYVAMFSMLGVESAQQHRELRHLGEYYQLEQRLRENFGEEKCCIIRRPMLAQFFYFMVPMVDDKNVLSLPVQKDKKWGVVDVSDVSEAVYRLSRENRGGRFLGPIQKNNKKVFEFTPKRNMNGPEIARAMNKAVEDREIHFEESKAPEIRKYLQDIRQDRRFRERPNEERSKSERAVRPDRPHHFPLGDHLNDQTIDVMIEFWELANRGQLDIIKDDLKQALHRDPQDLNNYFENNRDNFRRFR
ncbi:hypothetical protein DFQ28_005101 [Apophysomyces sp. BC1034]|nr:hypothetical protein DFQ30_004535 [Apophysomyces sp. BC1015]KAG0178294.1 hypothetical protein DFQ29_003673 [Apophysomyces sp. BC1021]KAG0193497.1 hypothetical protein DFQ28_005101 [Apophysomyces sp. BC1034]